MKAKPILGISMGDPYGNGPEITVRALADRAIYDRCRPLVVGVDSVSLLRPGDDGLIAVTASHGEALATLGTDGVGPTPALVTFNDAGIGKDGAGTGRLPLLQARGIPALTVSAGSARIGDARSCHDEGVISCANALALELGGHPGTPLKTVIDALLAAHDTH